MTSLRLTALSLAGVVALAGATPSMASEVGKNTFLGAASGAAAGGLLSHGSVGGIVAGGLVGGVLGHTLSPRSHRYYGGRRAYRSSRAYHTSGYGYRHNGYQRPRYSYAGY